MIDYQTPGIFGTGPSTRIRAFGIYASFVRWAVGIYETLRTTRRRGSDIGWKTRTGWIAIHVVALSIRTAWRWIARISRVFDVW